MEWRKDLLAKKVGVAPHTFQKRIDEKWPKEKLLSPPQRTNKTKTIVFKGEHVTFKVLGKRYNLSPELLRSRYALGLRDDELVKPVQKPKREPVYVTIDGVTYDLYELGKKYNVPEEVMYQRYYHGKRGIDLIAPYQEKRSVNDLITINGITQTVAQHAYDNNIDPPILLKRIWAGWEEEKLLAPVGTRFPKNYIVYEGKKYSPKEFAETFSIPVSTVRRWVKDGKDIAEMMKKRRNK